MGKKSITNNILWRFAERALAQIVAFIVSIILARILEPSLYGTVALITVFITILQVFVDSGLGIALIQKKDADDTDFSTVFYTNLCICNIIYLFIFLLAPTIASYYNNASMIPYIRVLGLTVLISGIKNVQQAYVSRHMLFRKFFFSTLGGTLISGVVGIIMALRGYGVWALIAQHIVNLSTDTLILWMTVKWRPIRAFDVKRLRGLFNFGSRMMLSRLIETVDKEIRQLIIGKIYSSVELAFYNRGHTFPGIIAENVNISIDSVLLPAMSNVQDNREQIRDLTRQSIMMSVYILAPIMMGLAAVSNTLVLLLLTQKWLPAIPYMRVFCVSYVFFPIHAANLNAIKALGRSGLFLRIEIIKKLLGLVALLVAMRISVFAMACSLLIMSAIGHIINSWPNKKLIGYGLFSQIKDVLPSLSLSLVMSACVYYIGSIDMPEIIVLIIQIITGFSIYIIGSKMLRLESYKIVRDSIKKL